MTAAIRSALVLVMFCGASDATAQGAAQPKAAPHRSLTRASVAEVTAILTAEVRRDSSDTTLLKSMNSHDVRVRTLARRAFGRIRDPKFAARDSFPALRAAPVYPDPDWRLRYRALKKPAGDCAAIRAALADRVWPVRLRAMDLVDASCTGDSDLVFALGESVDAMGVDASTRSFGSVSWHAGAHGLVALAHVQPAEARPRLVRSMLHAQWQVRAYAARAAAVLADTSILRTLARDGDDNVKEAAIDALSKLTGHADDALYLAALSSKGAQAVRAAAVALKGSPRPDAVAACNAAFERWVAHDNASSHDVREALLATAGRPIGDDRPPTFKPYVAPRAAELAMGADIKLRVTMSPAAGGGAFVVRLRGDVAPIMAARILELANQHYYDGLTWHRVEADFVIQGGSLGATEYIGLDQFLRDELGTVPHPRGTVGMSTRGHDTGDAQWFVNLKDNARLTKDYTIFGEVIEGIEVVDGVLEGDTILRIEEVRPAWARTRKR